MGFTSAGLPNGGRTAHYQISYNTALSNADGIQRATGLMSFCEQDFTLMSNWFGGINLEFSYPIPVQIANASGGASWTDPSNFQLFFGYIPTVTINPGSGTSVNFVRYLLVSEVTEMFMASQKKGWYENPSLFTNADEGSKGEGLSRFLGVQFQLANGLGGVPPAGFGVVPLWLNSPRQDFVDNNPDDNKPDPTVGCTTCFIYYLRSQLAFTINSIVAAASSNLAGVYQNLTGKSDAWTSFINLVNAHYPPAYTYNPAGDNIFPVSNLTQFYAPNQITCGYSQASPIFIDNPAMAQVNIQMTSDDTSVVTVLSPVTVPVGGTSGSVTFQAPAISGPFAPKFVNVNAVYAGKTLTVAAEIVPPAIASITLSPSSVTAGQTSIATVTLNLPSLAGDVVVTLTSEAPGFATVPATVTIPQNQSSMTFTVTTPNIQIPFKPAQAVIYASYSGTSASAVLTINPTVIAGILNSLVIFPTSVIIGGTSRGTVTLYQAVSQPTLVGLTAYTASLPGPGGSPPPGHLPSVATVPNSITIPAGQTQAVFNITTHGTLVAGRNQLVTIMAAATVEKYAGLTVMS